MKKKYNKKLHLYNKQKTFIFYQKHIIHES